MCRLYATIQLELNSHRHFGFNWCCCYATECSDLLLPPKRNKGRELWFLVNWYIHANIQVNAYDTQGPIRTRPYFAKLIDGCVHHKLSRVRTDDISGRNFRPGRTNIKGSDGLLLRDAVLEQGAILCFCFMNWPANLWNKNKIWPRAN